MFQVVLHRRLQLRVDLFAMGSTKTVHRAAGIMEYIHTAAAGG